MNNRFVSIIAAFALAFSLAFVACLGNSPIDSIVNDGNGLVITRPSC